MRLTTLPLLSAVIALLAAPVIANADDTKPGDKPAKTDTAADTNGKLSEPDLKILAHVHAVNQTEIDMGKLAQQRGGTAVKAYGATLIADHQSADKDVQAFVKKRGQTLPKDTMTDAEKADHKEMDDKMAKLKTLKGPEFDRQFLALSIEAHGKEIARENAAISTVTNPDLKVLLTAMIPVLQRHEDQARELQKAIPQT